MLVLNWPLVITITAGLYGLLVLSLPFSAVFATIMLFAIIAFWSRLPAAGTPNYFLFFVLYSADLVDVFSAFIAVSVGGIQGAIFSAFCNISSRLCGVYPSWRFVMQDVFGQFITCLIIPFVHVALGSNILYTVMAYTVIRIIIVTPIDFFTYGAPLAKYAMEWTAGIIIVFTINSFYGKLFGNFMVNLLSSEVAFSWILFLGVTAVIALSYSALFGVSGRDALRDLTKNVGKIVKKRVVEPVRKYTNQPELDKNKLQQLRVERDEMAEMEKIRKSL
jgi:hypothetical protein